MQELLASFARELVVPTPVIVETSSLIESRLGAAAEARLSRAVPSGRLHRQDLHDVDWGA